MNITKETINYDATISAELNYVLFNSLSDLRKIIDDEFVDIMHADPDTYDLSSTKRELLDFITSKAPKQKYGTVAEFFAHLTLRQMGYTQQCIFKNLEELSMKKGFDGLYALNNDFWLAESKSAFTNATHTAKIQEAINDLRKKIEDKSSNNPWMNAAHHIFALQNGKRNESITNRIKKLSSEYQRGICHKLEDYNIIPISTLFIQNTQDFDTIKTWCEDFLKDKSYNKIIFICLDNYVYDEFLEYLEN